MTGISGVVYPDPLQVGSQLGLMLQIIETNSGKNSVKEQFPLCHMGHVGGVSSKSVSGFSFCILDGFLLHREKLFLLLETKGIKLPQTNNDASLSANLFELMGTSFLDKIEGEFALCLYDKKKERILLARDRIGKKPLYWYHDQNHFLFSSKISALLASGIVSSAVSLEGVASYLFFGYFPQDLSPIKNVSKLLPAHYLYFYFNQSKVIHSYWSYSSYFNTSKQLSLPEAKQAVEQAIKLSIKEHEKVTKNTNAALLLSPDTGSLFLEKTMKENSWTGFSLEDSSKPIKEKINLKDSIMQEEMSATLKTLEQIVWSLDEPIGDPNIFKWWFLAKKMEEKNYTSLYTDTGFNELFTNQARYFASHLPPQDSCVVRFKKWSISLLLPFITTFWKRKSLLLLKSLRTDPWQFAYLRQNAVFSESLIKELAPKLHRFFDPEVFLHKFHHLDRIKGHTASCLYLDIKTRFADSTIPQIERLLNSRKILWVAPFLSRGCIEVCAHTVSSLHNTHPNQSAVSLLWPDFDRSFQQEVLKQGEAHNKNIYSKMVLANSHYLAYGLLSEAGIVERAAIESYLNSPKKMEESWRALFALLVLEVWMRSFTRGKIAPPKENDLKDPIHSIGSF